MDSATVQVCTYHHRLTKHKFISKDENTLHSKISSCPKCLDITVVKIFLHAPLSHSSSGLGMRLL